MQRISNTNITLTRGDTFKATVTMLNSAGEIYTPQSGDEVWFGMKQNYNDANMVINKQIPNNTMLLELKPADTKNLKTGKYVYDIEIKYANGDIDTFIDRASLTLTEEVHDVFNS